MSRSYSLVFALTASFLVLVSQDVTWARSVAPSGKASRAPKAPVRSKRPVPLIAPGPFGLTGLLISTLTGCMGKAAGGSCYGVDYSPGTRAYPDSDFDAIRRECRPDRSASWDPGTDGPELSGDCETAILDLLPLDTSLATSTASPGPAIRRNLVRAFHTLLFYPVGDDGDIFGSASEFDYCQDVYQDFLGASVDASSLPEIRVLSSTAYDSGYSQMNLHLVRFILERVSDLRSVDLDEAGAGTVARAYLGRIEFTRLFAEQNGAINLASVVVHEARHIGDGFPDTSDHLECASGESGEICDDSMFGSYGAQLSYMDSVIRAGLRTRFQDGTPLLSKLDVMSNLTSACGYYQARVNYAEGDLADAFGRDCGKLSEDTAAGLGVTLPAFYGLELDEVDLR